MRRRRKRLSDVKHTLLKLRREALYILWNNGVVLQVRSVRVMVPVAMR